MKKILQLATNCSYELTLILSLRCGVLLTVHLSIILVINQFNAQILVSL